MAGERPALPSLGTSTRHLGTQSPRLRHWSRSRAVAAPARRSSSAASQACRPKRRRSAVAPGEPGSADDVSAAAAKVPEALADAFGDGYASAEYRTHLASVLAGRALIAAFARATG